MSGERAQWENIVAAALEWQAWASAHPETAEGNADQDTTLYRVVSDYRAWCADEHTRLWADEMRERMDAPPHDGR